MLSLCCPAVLDFGHIITTCSLMLVASCRAARGNTLLASRVLCVCVSCGVCVCMGVCVLILIVVVVVSDTWTVLKCGLYPSVLPCQLVFVQHACMTYMYPPPHMNLPPHIQHACTYVYIHMHICAGSSYGRNRGGGRNRHCCACAFTFDGWSGMYRIGIFCVVSFCCKVVL